MSPFFLGHPLAHNFDKGRLQLNRCESNMPCKCVKIFSHICIAYCLHEDLVEISLLVRPTNKCYTFLEA